MEELDDIRKGALYALKSLGQTPAESAVFLNTSLASIMQHWDSIDDVGENLGHPISHQEVGGMEAGDANAHGQVPMPPIILADTLMFADVRVPALVALAEQSEHWMQAIVSADAFWEKGARLPPPVDLNAGISPLVSASIRFDPHRPVEIIHSLRTRVSTATRAQIARLSNVVLHSIKCSATLPLLFEMLPALRVVSLADGYGCLDGRTLQAFSALTSLESLTLQDFQDTKDFSFLTSLTSLRELDMGNCCKLKDIEPIASLKQLEVLRFSEVVKVSDISPLTVLPSLTKLRFFMCERLKDISPLGSIRSLRVLRVESCPVRDVGVLSSLTSLEDLSLRNCRKLSVVSSVGSLTALKKLDLGGLVELEDISSLRTLTGLEELFLGGCRSLEDISALESLVQLRRLDLASCLTETEELVLQREYCGMITNVSPLASLVNLEELRLDGCTKLTDASPLQSLKSLKELHFIHCYQLADISFVASLPSLKQLALTGSDLILRSPVLNSLDGVVVVTSDLVA